MPTVLSVSANAAHTFSKTVCRRIELVAGLGVVGDAHYGATVQHRSRVARDPSQPNLRQVHLLQAELFTELTPFALVAGELGENITTLNIDLLALPTGTRLHVGATAVIEITGLRNPCAQIELFRPGLLAAVLGRAVDGSLVRKAGVMGIVCAGGIVQAQDSIRLTLPPLPHRPLERV